MESLESRQMLSTTWTVTWDHDEADPGEADGQRSLREAIVRDAHPGDTINFAASLNGHTIALDQALGEIFFTKSLTIDGTGRNITIDASGTDATPGVGDGQGTRIFNIADNSLNNTDPPLVRLIGLTLSGGDPNPSDGPDEGGAIRSEGLLNVQDCTITRNHGRSGGGIWLDVAGGGAGERTVLDIEHSHIESNTAFMYSDGGGVFVLFTTGEGAADNVRINDSFLSHNQAGEGGALGITSNSSSGAAVTISSTLFEDNHAAVGGAIFDRSASRIDLSIVESAISGDSSTVNGGGLYALAYNGSQIYIGESTISGNRMLGGRAGLNVRLGDSSSLTVVNSMISGNSGGSGSGLYALADGGSQVRVEDSTISGNTSAGSGGGIFVTLGDSSSLAIVNSTISGNFANNGDGGGVFAKASSDTYNVFPMPRAITISRSLVSGNTATNRGGGVYIGNFYGTETLVEESRITGNQVPIQANGTNRNGGGIYAYFHGLADGTDKPKFTITGSTVDNNIAQHEGGGIFVCAKFSGNFVATNSTFSANSTLNADGAAGASLSLIPRAKRLTLTCETLRLPRISAWWAAA